MAEDSIRDTMECPAPESFWGRPQNLRNTREHFFRRLVGECKKEDFLRQDAPLQQMRHPIHDRSRLAGTGPSEHEARPIAFAHHAELLGI